MAGHLSREVWATNGHLVHGYGTKNKGMGGAGSALPQDAMAAATNPAGLVFVGRRLDVGKELVMPPRRYSISGNTFGLDGGAKSETDVIVVPHLATNWPIGERTALGVSVYAHSALSSDYPTAVFGGLGSHGRTGVRFTQLLINHTLAYKCTEQVAIGISSLVAYQEFSSEGLQAFGSSSADRARLTNRGDDDVWGFGLKIGALARWWRERVAVGVAYAPRIAVQKFDTYAGLLAEDGDLDTPSTFTAGLAVMVHPAVTVVGDYLRINYSEVNALSNPVSYLTQRNVRLGNDGGAGFGWNDIDVFKVGVQYEVNPTWTLRMGWNHGENPIEGADVAFNILAPVVTQDHLTFGFTKKVGERGELNVAYYHGFRTSVTGPIATTLGGGSATIQMYQNGVEVNYGWKF